MGVGQKFSRRYWHVVSNQEQTLFQNEIERHPIHAGGTILIQGNHCVEKSKS